MLLGYSCIDDEHRALVELLNDLADLPAGSDRERIAATLDEFIDAFERHCQSEVEVFGKLGYPKTESHESHHEELVGKLKELRGKGREPRRLVQRGPVDPPRGSDPGGPAGQVFPSIQRRH